MVLATACVFRWAVVYWTLAQIVIFCGAFEDPVHIQLHLDGQEIVEDEKKYDSLKQKEHLVKIWYDSQNAATPMYHLSQRERELIEKAGFKRLYIRGKFKIMVERIDQNNEKTHFLWDNGRKDAKALGEFILKIFKPGAVVIVVFPDDLQTYTGFKFQKEFEKVVQAENEGITVGRAVINVYLGLGDQVDTLLTQEIEKQKRGRQYDHENDERYSSIFSKYELNNFSFRTVFTSWTSYLQHVNIHQVKIQEADSVVVKLVSVCTSDQKHLKVGSHTAQDLATILVKLLHVDDVKTHPKQKIRVELPEKCETSEEKIEFTGHLVDNLQEKMKNIKVYGKEPHVHIQVYINDMINDINYIMAAYPQDIYAEIEDKVKYELNDKHSESISSAKELFIHLHCHGNFFSDKQTFCNKDSVSLANTLSEFLITICQTPNSRPKTGTIQFHGCEAGSDNGEKYVIEFLTKLDELLHTHQISIQESLSYIYKTTQIKEHTQVMVPFTTRFDLNVLSNVNEREVFGRFTVRTVKTANGYSAFSVLPFTEYNLIYSE